MGSVLIIDADDGFTNDLTRSLAALGVETEVIADGATGLESARNKVPAAIVLCVELPKISGYSICSKIKADARLKQVPLIITSSEATLETFDKHKRLKARAEDYMRKPFAASTLVSVLSPYLTLQKPDLIADFDDDDELRTTVAGVPLVERLESLEKETRGKPIDAASMTPTVVNSSTPGNRDIHEILDLKKKLNAKDREVLELKYQVQAREKSLLVHRDQEMELETKIILAHEQYTAAEQARLELDAQLAALHTREVEQKEQIETTIRELREEAGALRSALGSTQEINNGLRDEAKKLQLALRAANDANELIKQELEDMGTRLARAYRKIRGDDEAKLKATEALEMAAAILRSSRLQSETEKPEATDLA